jgi:serine protease Do
VVVSISNLKKLESSAFHYRHDEPESWLSGLKRWFEELTDRTYQAENLGSGLILTPNGHILTSYHIIEKAERLMVRLHDGSEFAAHVVGRDTLSDLAVLKIFTLRRLPRAPIGESENLKIGEWVMAIGNPYGLEGTVTVGIVSGKGKTAPDDEDVEDDVIQTDASINPGNSGGPLINLDGKIVGINSRYPDDEDAGRETGFTIPIEKAMRIGRLLIEKGGIERGWMGAGIQSLTPELAASFNLPHLKGAVLVNSIENMAPADSGGLRQGDIIIQFDGKPVSGSKMLQRWVENTRIGKEVPVRIIREGAEQTLTVKIGRLDGDWLAVKSSVDRLQDTRII